MPAPSNLLSIQRWWIDRGAPFFDDDGDRAADVCVIGRSVQERLFGPEDPIARVVRLSGGTPCKVVGSVRAFWYRSKKCLH